MSSSAKRALTVLKLIAAAHEPPGVSDIARALHLPPGTVFRSLDALARAGMIARARVGGARYVPGPALETLRQSLLASFPVREVALPFLHQLASITGETVSFAVRLGWTSVTLASARGTGEVTNAPPPLGRRLPLSQTGAGRAILAHLPDAEVKRYFAWSKTQENAAMFSSLVHGGGGSPPGETKGATRPATKRGTSKETRALSDLKQTLALIAEQGYARDTAPHAAISLPMRPINAAVAAITIEGPFPGPADPAAPSLLRKCEDVILGLERIARQQDETFIYPFGHLLRI